MNSAKVGLSVLEVPVLCSLAPRWVVEDAEWSVRRVLVFEAVLEERSDLVIVPAVANMRLRSGRRVARQPAMMLAPHSMVDQIAMLVAFQKKSSIWVRPSTYWNRIMEQMQALAARQRINPTENLDRLSMFAFQRTTIGNTTKTRSVSVEKVAF
jgi:hypothetical protein